MKSALPSATGGLAGDQVGHTQERVWAAIALAAILVVAAILRFYDLGRTSLWYDEAASWQQANQSFIGMLQATARDNYPPLHNIILNLTIRLFGDGEVALRAPSALLGTATVWLLYRLGATLWDRTTGLIAALMLALSGYHVWYSTEARMYALLAFTATLYVLCVVRAVRREEPFAAAACAGAAALLLYSHVYGAFVFIGVNLAVIGGILAGSPAIRIRWRHWLIWQAAAGLLFLPWAIILLGRAQHVLQGFWIPEPSPDYIHSTFVQLAGGRGALVLLVVMIFLALLERDAAVAAIRRRGLPKLNVDWALALIVAWISVPFLIGYAISVTRQPILHPRYLICILPALFLLGARGLRVFIVHPVALPVAFAATLMVAQPALSRQLERTRDDYRTAATLFAERFLPTDHVIFQAIFPRAAFTYYFREPLPSEEMLVATATPDLEGRAEQRIWYVRAHLDDVHAERALAALSETHELDFSERFGRRQAIHLFVPRVATR